MKLETLTDSGERLQLPAGYGPRHLAFWHEDMEGIYVLCELASRVVVFAEKKQKISAANRSM